MYVVNTKNGKYKYCEDYKDPLTGKWKTKSVTYTDNKKSTVKLAQRELDKRISEVTTIKTDTVRLKYLIDLFLTHHSGLLKESTFKAYTSNCNALYRILSDCIISDDTFILINRKLIDSSFSTKRIFNLIMNFAYQYHYIDKKYSIRCNHKKRDLKLYYEKSEIKEILDKLHEQSGYNYKIVALLVEFLTLTGLRIGEALALDYTDIQGNILYIHKTVYEDKITAPKTALSNRQIGINNRTIELIQDINNLRDTFCIKSTECIFVDAKGNRLKYEQVHYLLRTLKIDPRVHLFRHTHASLLAEQGISLDVIQRRLGHSSDETTKQVYIHVTNNIKNKELDLFKELDIL